MDFFEYKNGELFAENVAISAIAQQHGTPCYVYSRATFERHFKAYQDALGSTPHLICYAVKASSNIAILNILAKLGAGFDIVSEGELERVLHAGGDASKVVFSGVGKLDVEIRRALTVGIHCFNVESESELYRIEAIASEMGKVAPISLRVNPDVDAKTHPYISTGLKDNKFGIDINIAKHLYAKAAASPHLNIKGIDCHIGSQLTEVKPFIDALHRVLALVDELASHDIFIEHLDLGGGLGVRYDNEVPPNPSEYIQAITAELGDRKLKLMFEPGRSIAANAGILVAKVEYLKHNEHKNFAIIDAAMNDLIRPALYSAWQSIIPVAPHNASENIATMPYDIVGPVCETGDFLGKNRELALCEGDLLAIRSSGAYGFTMSSNYNSRNRAVEIMVDDTQAYVIRARETFAHQMAGEAILPE